MEIGSVKAPREFNDIKSIEAWFHRNPEKLLLYVNSAMKWGRAVFGVHLLQLSAEVRIPLEYNGKVLILTEI